ncbi:MAG: hypothetical protein IT305_25330 [Chloroflexi bacterium]|nr:hypothetical protein [Chloroflexota bacterium]
MERVCLTIPILSGAVDQARAFFEELENDRYAAYQESQERIGVLSETWFIGKVAGKDTLIGFVTYKDFARAVEIISGSTDEFDVWFKQGLKGSTGLDLENPPELDLPTLVSDFPR